MAKKKRKGGGVVYSTDPNFDYDNPFASLGGLLGGTDATDGNDEDNEPPKRGESLRVFLDRKQRKGKAVTLVRGFSGSDEALQALGKTLKSKCGVGGSVKDGEIIIQGDQRDKVVQLLIELGYTNTKRSGG